VEVQAIGEGADGETTDTAQHREPGHVEILLQAAAVERPHDLAQVVDHQKARLSTKVVSREQRNALARVEKE
jgi:hypothetical protein